MEDWVLDLDGARDVFTSGFLLRLFTPIASSGLNFSWNVSEAKIHLWSIFLARVGPKSTWTKMRTGVFVWMGPLGDPTGSVLKFLTPLSLFLSYSLLLLSLSLSRDL